MGLYILNDNLISVKDQGPADSKIFVGPKENPIGIIKRGEIVDYLDEDFYSQYDLWQKYHIGFGFPFPGTWLEQPKIIIDVIEYIELLYRNMRR